MLGPSHSLMSSQPQSDLDALLTRMRQRLYPETIPVLASYWLKTVYAAGHSRAWWRQLNELLKQVLRKQLLDGTSREALIDIQSWIQETGLRSGKTSGTRNTLDPLRPDPEPERLAPYIQRLLNQWLMTEVASTLVNGGESGIPQDGGTPVLAIATSLERLLLRDRLAPGTLEMLLRPDLVSPRDVYPCDMEVLADIVLALLGRTWTAAPAVMPATLLGVATWSALSEGYGEAVRHASYVQTLEGDEVHVPIAAAQASEILNGDPVRIASIIVTMDGRCWEAESLQSGAQHSVIYKPRCRLRIDLSADHAKLIVPWPEAQLHWPGAADFQRPFELFGREWHQSRWEMDGEHAWLHLVFSRVLPIAEIQPHDVGLRRSHLASVDMAWAALEEALATSLSQKGCEPVEQLRRTDFIPLGRAIFGLTKLAKSGGLVNRDAIDTQLRAIRYLQAQVSVEYGRVPWRILPVPVQTSFLRKRPDNALIQLLSQVFDGLPEALSETTGQRSPSHAA
ncbi:MAG: hypothetical protein JWP63_1939 [Candidatus Solibacter sp.]|nr:hypothetical protein [Candidatus Solibacter sp.]